LKQLKEALRRNGVIFDNIGAVSSVLDAQMSPETLSMVRQYQRGLKDFDGTMTVQQSRESDEPDIPLTKVLGSIALQNKYKHADFFEKEQIIKATAPDGSVTEIVVPAGAKIDPFVDVYRTQGGQLVDADGNVVTLGPEITFGSMPDGTTFETDTRIARKSNGSPIILTNREMKARARKRTELIQAAIDSAKDDGSGVRLSDTGNGNYRGVMSPAQIEAFMALPNEVVSPNLKRMTKFFNELMARNDGTRVVMEYQAALLNGRYKALSPKIRDEVPIGFQLTKDGNFALTTISVSRLYDKMQAWADKKPANLQLWNGDTGAFWDSLTKLLDNHSRGEKGEIGLHPDAYIAEKMKNKINDLFNAYNAETKQANPDRSTLPRARGKDNLDIVIRSRRLDRINNFEESPSQKLPINYGYLTTNYMPAVNPMAAPMTAEEVQNRFDGSVTATRVRQAMATGDINALESELRQMDDLLPTESLQLVQGQDQIPRIQIVSMFDPENVASLEPEEIVSDIDAETEAELAILDSQDGTVPPQEIAQVLSSKLDQLYADGGRSPIIPALESELEKIYQQLESQAQEQEAATEDVVEAPEATEADIMNSPTDLIAQAVDNYNTGNVDNTTQTLPEYIRSVVDEAGILQILPDVTDEQIEAAANDVVQYRESLKDRIRSGTAFSNAVVAPAGLQFLPAFHGSPYDFDKFRMDKIGSGEGAQAYGFGLYFSGARGVAKQYQTDLSVPEFRIKETGEVIKEDDERFNNLFETYKRMNSSGYGARFSEQIDVKHGNLYTVDLDVDDADLLDWDGSNLKDTDDLGSGKINDSISKKILGWEDIQSIEDFEQKLKEAEREFAYGGETGFYNLAMDDARQNNLQDVVDYWAGAYVNVAATGEKIYNYLSATTSPKQASEYLNSIGIPGIRYLDGTSRKQGEGTYNYVVFDENLITILDKNDKPVEGDLPKQAPLAKGENFEVSKSGDVFVDDVTKPIKFTKDIGLQFMPARPEVNLEDYIDKPIIALTADRMGVGKAYVGPKGAEQEVSQESQGGPGFSFLYTDEELNPVWGFTRKEDADRFVGRITSLAKKEKSDSVLVAPTLLSPDNHLHNPTGQLGYAEAINAAIKANLLDAKLADSHIEQIMQRVAAGKGMPQADKDKFSAIKSLADFTNAVKAKEINFRQAAVIREKAAAKTLPISVDDMTRMGILPSEVAKNLSQEGFYELPTFSVVSLFEVPANQKPEKGGYHYSYPWIVRGNAIGFLKNIYNLDKLTSAENVRSKKTGELSAQPVMVVMPQLDPQKIQEASNVLQNLNKPK
jgi:hypothetical protein